MISGNFTGNFLLNFLNSDNFNFRTSVTISAMFQQPGPTSSCQSGIRLCLARRAVAAARSAPCYQSTILNLAAISRAPLNLAAIWVQSLLDRQVIDQSSLIPQRPGPTSNWQSGICRCLARTGPTGPRSHRSQARPCLPELSFNSNLLVIWVQSLQVRARLWGNRMRSDHIVITAGPCRPRYRWDL